MENTIPDNMQTEAQNKAIAEKYINDQKLIIEKYSTKSKPFIAILETMFIIIMAPIIFASGTIFGDSFRLYQLVYVVLIVIFLFLFAIVFSYQSRVIDAKAALKLIHTAEIDFDNQKSSAKISLECAILNNIIFYCYGTILSSSESILTLLFTLYIPTYLLFLPYNAFLISFANGSKTYKTFHIITIWLTVFFPILAFIISIMRFGL